MPQCKQCKGLGFVVVDVMEFRSGDGSTKTHPSKTKLRRTCECVAGSLYCRRKADGRG